MSELRIDSRIFDYMKNKKLSIEDRFNYLFYLSETQKANSPRIKLSKNMKEARKALFDANLLEMLDDRDEIYVDCMVKNPFMDGDGSVAAAEDVFNDISKAWPQSRIGGTVSDVVNDIREAMKVHPPHKIVQGCIAYRDSPLGLSLIIMNELRYFKTIKRIVTGSLFIEPHPAWNLPCPEYIKDQKVTHRRDLEDELERIRAGKNGERTYPYESQPQFYAQK